MTTAFRTETFRSHVADSSRAAVVETREDGYTVTLGIELDDGKFLCVPGKPSKQYKHAAAALCAVTRWISE
jgi:hypothetical protein